MLKIFAIIILLNVIKVGLGISCWQCNSIRDTPRCAEVPKGPINREDLDEELKKYYFVCGSDSNDDDSSDSNATSQYTLCRKQVQIIDGVTRIIRQCGIQKSYKECYITANPPVKTHVCDCEGDGCNASFHLYTSQYLIAISSLLIIYGASKAIKASL